MVESFGGVNIKFDLLLRRTTLGGVEFKSAISGTQSVFSADARLSGSMNLSGEWNADLEIDEGKIDLPAIKATRVSGNGSIAGGPKNPAAFIMQLSAGGVILFNLPWHNVSATAEGNAEHYTILCEGKSVGHEGIEFTLNLPDGLALTNLSGSVHTQKFSDLFSYLKSNKVLAGKAYYPLFFDYLGPLSLDFLTQLADDQATPLTDIAYTVRDENGMMNVEGTGKIDQKTKIVTGNLSMPSMPVDGAAKGGIAIDGSFQTDYTDGNLKTKGKLKANLSDAVFSVGLFEFRNVNANLAFNDLASFSSDGSQKVTFALPLKESVKQSGKASLSIQNGKKIRIEGPALDIFGGKIAAADLALGAEKEVKNILLTLTSINLGDVSTALTIDGLSLEGRLKGSLPIKFKEGKAYIEDGILSNDGDGTIHFTPSKIPTFLQGDDISLETARMALENYRYDFFEVRMNGPLKENMDITINARGHNPDLFEKRPVAINLNTSAALGPLFSHILEDADDDEVEESH